MCEEGVPQEGQGAVGDVVLRVNVISKATSTSSTWTSGRSGKMIIESLEVLKRERKMKKCSISQYTTSLISRGA
jgi:hypothetical protein